ncbi:pur operon repressor [Tuanshanicoccus lijuaniae]|uniref:pur operon repressor n=1 Tax=Aerococcaceae bacterium zg-1292 TaxID=2774330 RepID=UPI0019388C7D|nr:pur operon repressor [Aerococcaceae bacterium zg-1292]MBF6625410.1 pur operon repressor [Aerococcaceae bacterium zg-BR9]MBF6979071.1 pur operon repressor [Aerococcaceae bacterium zg-BR22]QQA37168.1 pur operon repressor [Aerococcaceae bacterium zg-1292]
MEPQSKKTKRNQRIVYISQYFISHPNQLVSLSYFADYFACAKSSISEDIDFIRDVFQYNQLGTIQTIAGVQGGMIYLPTLPEQEEQSLMAHIQAELASGKRILPGNYVYLADLLQKPHLLDAIAKLIASKYQSLNLDAVVTIETKGIGLCVEVARYLNIPHVVVRRSSSDMDGSTISVNYVSGSHQRVSKMELSKASLQPGSRVLIIDDFLRNGGTMLGLMSLIEEFDCKTVARCVFVESTNKDPQPLPAYDSLLKVEIVYNKEASRFELQSELGNFFDKK